MSGHQRLSARFAAAVLMTPALAACAKTSRVEDTVSPATLATSAKGVAVMRLGAGSAACRNLSVLLGTREPGGHFKHTRTVNVVDVRSLTSRRLPRPSSIPASTTWSASTAAPARA